eukprot:1160128-Pelagomonas_calceolata.AAC.3
MLPPVQKKHSSGDHNTSSIRRGSKQRTGTSLDKPGEHTHTSHWESVWRDAEVHLQQASRDGLHVRSQLQLGELVHQAVQRLAVLGHADELTQLLQV